MATTGIGTASEKDSEMMKVLRANAGAVHILNERVQVLAKKLEPVLRMPNAGNPNVRQDEPPSSVPIIQLIADDTTRVRAIMEVVGDLIDRLPL